MSDIKIEEYNDKEIGNKGVVAPKPINGSVWKITFFKTHKEEAPLRHLSYTIPQVKK